MYCEVDRALLNTSRKKVNVASKYCGNEKHAVCLIVLIKGVTEDADGERKTTYFGHQTEKLAPLN